MICSISCTTRRSLMVRVGTRVAATRGPGHARGRRPHGRPGRDERVGVEAFLGRAPGRAEGREYRPLPVRRVKIPKGGSGSCAAWGFPRSRHSAAASSRPSDLLIVHPFHVLFGRRVPVLFAKRRAGKVVFVCEGGPLGRVTVPRVVDRPRSGPGRAPAQRRGAGRARHAAHGAGAAMSQPLLLCVDGAQEGSGRVDGAGVAGPAPAAGVGVVGCGGAAAGHGGDRRGAGAGRRPADARAAQLHGPYTYLSVPRPGTASAAGLCAGGAGRDGVRAGRGRRPGSRRCWPRSPRSTPSCWPGGPRAER